MQANTIVMKSIFILLILINTNKGEEELAFLFPAITNKT